MGKEINHTCIVCGTGYHACDTCNELKKINSWQRLTDTSNHYKIFQILNDYDNKIIDKKRAYSMLGKCDLKGYERFYPNITKLINDILSYENEVVETKEEEKENKQQYDKVTQVKKVNYNRNRK